MTNFICAILILLCYGICDAATYYVRTDGDNAKCNGVADAAALSAPNCAKNSIQAAIDLSYASDVVIVHSGNYSNINPSFTTIRNGTEGKMITIRSAEGDDVIVSRFEINNQYIKTHGFRVISAGNQYSAGIQINASNVTVSGNIINGRGLSSVGITTFAKGWQNNVSITGNILEGQKTISTSFDIGIYVAGDNISVSNNIVRNVDSIERAFEVYGSNITLSRNECYDWIYSDGSAHPDIFQIFGSSSSSNILVENNYFHDIDAQIGNLSSTGGTKSWIFRNNIFANITSAIFTHIPMEFYNNLFYRCGTIQNHPILQYSGSSVIVKNNAFIGCGNGDASTRGWYDGADIKDYNFVSTVSGNVKSGFAGLEKNGVNGGNLGFIAPFSNCLRNKCNFGIKEDSALANRGVAINELFYDYSGVRRPQGGSWSIGPFEPINSAALELMPPRNLKIY